MLNAITTRPPACGGGTGPTTGGAAGGSPTTGGTTTPTGGGVIDPRAEPIFLDFAWSDARRYRRFRRQPHPVQVLLAPDRGKPACRAPPPPSLGPGAISAIASGRAIAPLTFGTGSCGALGGNCVINPANGNLLIQFSPPAGDPLYIAPVLSYNSSNASTLNEIANGWSHTFRRQVVGVAGASPVLTGTGQTYAYSGPTGGTYFTPAAGSGAVNTLFVHERRWRRFIETQPDGTAFNYPGTNVRRTLGSFSPSRIRPGRSRRFPIPAPRSAASQTRPAD